MSYAFTSHAIAVCKWGHFPCSHNTGWSTEYAYVISPSGLLFLESLWC